MSEMISTASFFSYFRYGLFDAIQGTAYPLIEFFWGLHAATVGFTNGIYRRYGKAR